MQYDVQQLGGSNSMCWIVHIFILDWHKLCTAVNASCSTSYYVVYAKVASQVENRPGAGIREEADQRCFTVLCIRGQRKRLEKM